MLTLAKLLEIGAFMKHVSSYALENDVGTITTTSGGGKDMNNFTEKGVYVGSSWTQGSGVFPGDVTNGYLEVIPYTANTYVIQRFTPASSGADKIYQRKLINSSWTSWYLFTGTEVT